MDDTVTRAPSARLVFLLGLRGSGVEAVERALVDSEGVVTRRDRKGAVLPGDGLIADGLVEEDFGGIGFFPQAPCAFAQPWEERSLQRLRQSYLQASPAQGERVVYAAPSLVLHASALAKALPEARFVVVSRHPVEAAYAARRAGLQAKVGVSTYLDAHLAAWHGLQAQLPALRHVHVVRWEDLARDPADTLAALAAYLELPSLVTPTSVLSELLSWDEWEGWRQEGDAERERVWGRQPAIEALGYAVDRPWLPGDVAPPSAGTLPDADAARPYAAAAASDPRPAGAGAEGLDEALFVLSLAAPEEQGAPLALARAARASGRHVALLGTWSPLSDLEVEGFDLRGAIAMPFPSQRDVDPALSPRDQEDAYWLALRSWADEHLVAVLRRVTAALQGVSSPRLVVHVPFDLTTHLEVAFGARVAELQRGPMPAGLGEEEEDASWIRYAWALARHTYAEHSVGLHKRVLQAAAALGWEVGAEALAPCRTLASLKRRPVLQPFPVMAMHQQVPGLRMVATGFPIDRRAAQESATVSRSVLGLSADLEGCWVLGWSWGRSLASDTPPEPLRALIVALQQRPEPVVVLGDDVPAFVAALGPVLPVSAAPAVLRQARALVHGGWSDWTAAALHARTPSLVLPLNTRGECGVWANFIEETGWGVTPRGTSVESIARSLEELASSGSFAARLQDAPIEHLLDPSGERLWRALDQELAGCPVFHREAAARLEALAVHGLHASRQMWHGVWTALRMQGQVVEEARYLQGTFFQSMASADRHYPLRKADWPEVGERLVVEEQDRPHESSLQEWWYLHAHVQDAEGRAYSVFAALFERVVGEERFAHAHASVLDVETGRHLVRSLGDPTAPRYVAPFLKQSKTSDHFRQSLAELFGRGEFPAPDEAASGDVSLPRDRLDHTLGDFRIARLGEGQYKVSIESQDKAGFSLTFTATKPPILNGLYGIVHGAAAGEHMYYYSYTRMAVEGQVVVQGEARDVHGSGWYDHEFGGDRDRQIGGIDGASYAWSWLGIQLEDGTELVYATLLDRHGRRALHEDEVLFIDAQGVRTYHRGALQTRRTWTSMRTYVEYEVAWRFEVPSLGLELDLEAESDVQELQSVIAMPSYWEGRVRVSGTRDGQPISGLGFCEQFGRAGDRADYRTFLKAVSAEVKRSVEKTAPYELSDERLRDFVADERFENLLEGVDKGVVVDTMIRPVRTMIDRGGKSWRSMGMMVCADAVGGETHGMRDYLSFPEFLHTGSLIIDDIQDNSATRRGGPSCHVLYGVPIAINAGTSAYFFGEALLRDLDLTPEEWIRVYRLYFLCLRGAHTGQAMDIHGLGHLLPEAMHRGDFERLWQSLMSIHRLKSGLPPMIGARCGVIFAHREQEVEDILGDYFLALGTAFQVMDDVINLRGFSNGLKDHAEDLVEGKLTAPVIQAFRVLDERDRERMWHELRAPHGARDIHAMLHLIDKADAMAWCHGYARDMVEKAWLPVDSALPASHAKVLLRAFGRFVVDIRDY